MYFRCPARWSPISSLPGAAFHRRFNLRVLEGEDRVRRAQVCAEDRDVARARAAAPVGTMFESFYTSFWQHPLLLWLFPIIFWVKVRPGRVFFERAVLAFLVLTIFDPLFTGPVPQLLGWQDGVAQGVMIFFVLLGDFRFFFFIERFSRPGAEARQSITLAIFLTLLVPLLQAALIRAFPDAFENPRHTFLAYELLFVALAIFYRSVLLSRRQLTQEIRTWLRAISGYGAVYYALWAAADLVILAGYDSGFLLRVIPNVLYYGLFIPFVYLKAPASLKRRDASEKGEG